MLCVIPVLTPRLTRDSISNTELLKRVSVVNTGYNQTKYQSKAAAFNLAGDHDGFDEPPTEVGVQTNGISPLSNCTFCPKDRTTHL